MIATSGDSSRNDPSLSSASATKSRPAPSSAPSPVSVRIPPMTYPGSAPQSRSTVVSMDVVVVLPCVPATAITRRPAMTEASAAARCMTRRPRRVASASSGLSARIALDRTRVSPGPRSPRLAPACPTYTRAPSACRSSSMAEAIASLPDTLIPRASMIRAMPDMPAPPIPVKCTRPSPMAGTGSVGVMRLLSIWLPTPALPLHDLDDRLGEPAIGVAAAQRRGRLRHVRDLVDVDQHGQQRVPDPLGGQVGVVDQHAAAPLHDRQRVQPLLAVPDGERHVGGRQAHGGEL